MRLSLFAAAAVLLAGCATPTPPVATISPERVKNVIFLVGAGMGINTLTAARIYSVGEEGDLTIDTLPESAFVKTYSNDAQATDGAAAMAAYMTGVKVNNGGCGPGSCAPTLADLARAGPRGRPRDNVERRRRCAGCRVCAWLRRARRGKSWHGRRPRWRRAGRVLVPHRDRQRATGGKPGKDAHGNGSIDNCGVNNGTAPMTILELAKAHGKSVGAITTTELTHATPASTFAHSCNRNLGYSIAQQLVPGGAGYNTRLGDGIDVLMGGGRQHFTPYDAATNKHGRADGRNLLDEMAARGYFVAATRADMLSNRPGRKFVGIYAADGHLDYGLTRGATQLALAGMTARSIDLLAKNPEGFFLMVEGGKIDHALHDSNVKNALVEAVDFDAAIQTAIDKMRSIDPGLENTLIVVTADHDHTIVMNGTPQRGNPVNDIVRGVDGQPARDADGKTYTTLVFGSGPNRPDLRADVASSVAMADDYKQETGVRLAGEGHGGGDVKLFATGAGSAPFRGTMENTHVFDLMKAAFGF